MFGHEMGFVFIASFLFYIIYAMALIYCNVIIMPPIDLIARTVLAINVNFEICAGESAFQ